jgi:hypothetical protein
LDRDGKLNREGREKGNDWTEQNHKKGAAERKKTKSETTGKKFRGTIFLLAQPQKRTKSNRETEREINESRDGKETNMNHDTRTQKRNASRVEKTHTGFGEREKRKERRETSLTNEFQKRKNGCCNVQLTAS